MPSCRVRVGVTHKGVENWSVRVLGLVRTIVAALIAVCVAIFPIAMPRAAALTDVGGMSVSHQAAAHSDEHAVLGEHSEAAHHEHASHGHSDGNESSCCGTTACHAFQVSAGPSVSALRRLIGPIRIACDQQVAEALPGRLDRPPRTV
jgi:hypothetical protein